MKNIHVLPTDKPSRLFEIIQFNLSFDNQNMYSEEYKKLHSYKNKNIYITSDEDIDENDYIITKDGRLVQISYLLSKDLEGASKVILTTGQDLIKDGVQAIDDDFLEWFVKNPSCEEVKTEKWLDDEGNVLYSRIIPKEESFKHKVESLSTEEVLANRSNAYEFIDFDKDMKQTAVEWLVCRIIQDKKHNDISDKVWDDIFEQAKEIEKQQKGYSEGDMLKSFHCGKLYQGREGHIYFEQLINKLKNK